MKTISIASLTSTVLSQVGQGVKGALSGQIRENQKLLDFACGNGAVQSGSISNDEIKEWIESEFDQPEVIRALTDSSYRFESTESLSAAISSIQKVTGLQGTVVRSRNRGALRLPPDFVRRVLEVARIKLLTELQGVSIELVNHGLPLVVVDHMKITIKAIILNDVELKDGRVCLGLLDVGESGPEDSSFIEMQFNVRIQN